MTILYFIDFCDRLGKFILEMGKRGLMETIAEDEQTGTHLNGQTYFGTHDFLKWSQGHKAEYLFCFTSDQPNRFHSGDNRTYNSDQTLSNKFFVRLVNARLAGCRDAHANRFRGSSSSYRALTPTLMSLHWKTATLDAHYPT